MVGAMLGTMRGAVCKAVRRAVDESARGRIGPALAGATLALVVAALPLGRACAADAGPAGAPAKAPAATDPVATPCPAALPTDTRCLGGRDAAGAWVLIAVPHDWNGVLVLHTHGGPELGPPKAARVAEDLDRWSMVVRAGYAWAGSSYRQGGVAVHAAAEDTERLRQAFIDRVGAPRRTLLHGQSWGASVAAVAASVYAHADHGRSPYDGVLLTSGVLGGGTRSYDVRLDLRVVYQAVCGNHPRPDEPGYPLWQGLPPGMPLTRSELAHRVDTCTGLRRPAGERTAAQRQALDTLTSVLRIPESALLGHLAWATWHFQDIVFERLHGANPFGNIGAVYRGSPDDDALNARVARYRADPAAVAALAADTDPDGRIPVPVLTAHAIDDPVAFVELESAWHDTMQRAGTADHLVQVFTAESDHSRWRDPDAVALLAALLAWVDRGERPDAAAVLARCRDAEPAFGPGCRFRPDYRPAPLSARVAPRERH